MKTDLIVKNATQLATVDLKTATAPNSDLKISCLENATIACCQGQIVACGSNPDLFTSLEPTRDCCIIDAAGKTVLPGFVDAHTHPVFASTREHEFEQRIAGKTYQEIAASGGGIRSSVRALRQASNDELFERTWPRLDWFLQHGTTTIEAKSGYGLSPDAEIKMLQVIQALNRSHPLDLIPTFLGGHEIPDEFRDHRLAYIELLEQEMLPRVREQNLAEFCDVFCEPHVFTVPEARRILQAGMAAGLKPKIHAEQLTPNGGGQLAAELGAISADHLDYIDAAGIASLKAAGVVPVLLPGSVFFLHLSQYAPARQMLKAGLPVALASDFNPGSCPCFSMPMIMTLACTQMRMTPEEALIAATFQGARALNRTGKIGVLAVGLPADFVIFDVPNYRSIPYHFGGNLVQHTIKHGKVVYSRSELTEG